MNKVHVITKYFYPLQGGIEVSMMETFSRLARDGFEITVHTSRDDYEGNSVFAGDEKIKGIKIKRYQKNWYGFWPDIDWENAGIVTMHNFNILPHLLIMIFTLWQKIKSKKNYLLILQTHGGYMPRWSEFSWPAKIVKYIYHATLGKWMVNLAVDRVRAVSRWEEDELRARGFRQEIMHIPSGIEDMAFSGTHPGAGQKADDPVKNLGRYLIQVGKIKRVKNHITAIKALNKLPADIKLVIVGQVIEEEYFNELNEAIYLLGLTGRVLFTGYVDNEMKYYLIKNALAMINLPPIECYGSVVYEAMAKGAITIVGEGTAPARLSRDNQFGFVINPLSEEDALKAVQFILNNQDSVILQKMREKAKESVKDHSWEAASLGFKDLFRPKETNRTYSFDKYIIAGFIFFCSFILLFSLRGLPGNPTADELNSAQWQKDGPFELSPERGRFALLYSLAEDKSTGFSRQLAEFTVPDLGLAPDGRFVSLFTPGVSLITIPGYLAGKFINLSQVGAFAVISIFALANCWLIIRLSRRLGAGLTASLIGAATFIFATPAFAYSVTLYQHHITVFLLLACVYLLLSYNNWQSLCLVWFFTGASLLVDSPNFFLFLPVGIFSLFKIINFKYTTEIAEVKLSLAKLLVIIALIPPILMLGWYNYRSNGNPFKLSGTLPAVAEITAEGKISTFKASDPEVQENTADKQAIGFFATRNLLKGFFTHFISRDRGILQFAPVILLGIFGLFSLYRRQSKALNIILAITGLNILLYSMWGDPYGGWAFGSRYLIPAYAFLAVGIAVWLSSTRFWLAAALIFCFLFGYSVWVNSLGALTSNMNPPRIEVLALEAVSGKEEKYTYERNWDFLVSEGSKSYVWRAYLKNSVSALAYHRIIFSLILIFVLSSLFYGRLIILLKKFKL